MESINLRQTTFQDVQPMFRRWRRWGKYDGPCNQSRCTFYISLIDLDTPLNRFLYVHNRLFDLAAALGEHPTAIHARLTVLDGRVWSEGIAFGIETRGWYADGKTYIEIVGGAATSVSRINTHFGGAQWRLHPDYVIWWPTNLKNEVRMEFTPFAHPADVHRLMDLNFSCLTRTIACSDKKDIMPAALAQVAYWSSLPDDPNAWKPQCEDPDPLVLQLSARDARNIVIAKLAAKRPVPDYRGPAALRIYKRTLILEQVLKATATSIIDREPANLWMFESPGSKGTHRPGTSVILFLKDDQFDGYSLEGCSPLSVTPAHLSIVRRGITEDTRPSGLPDYAFQPVPATR